MRSPTRCILKFVLVLWGSLALSFLSPRQVMADQKASEQENEQDVIGQLLEELDLEEVDGTGWEPEELPEKLEFSDLVEAFVEKGTDGMDGGTICD